MPFQINLIAGRYQVFTGVLLDANGNAIVIAANSDILFKVYRGAGATPDLDVNGTQLPGGSVTSFTAGAGANQGAWQIIFGAADTQGLTALSYDVEVDLVDAGNGNVEKPADRGVLNMLGQPLGNTT